jgi:hypothetical protein
MTHHKPSRQQGFALLITLLSVGVIVSATLAIVELSRLQLRLSVDSRDAEVAFSAANAAKECAQYIRTTASSTISNGNNITSSCFGTNFNASRVNTLTFPVTGSGGVNNVYQYGYRVTWGGDSGFPRCSEVTMIVVYANTNDVVIGSTASPLRRVISNYRNPSMTCVRGSECTIIAAAGYNSTCNQRNNAGVLKREVLLEF